MTDALLPGDLRPNRSPEDLLEALEHGTPEEQHTAAVDAWQIQGTRAGSRAVSLLIQLLRASADDQLKVSAAYGLGDLRDARARRVLLSTLQNRKNDMHVRGYAAEALSKIIRFKTRDKGVMAALYAALEEESAYMRYEAAYAMGQMGSEEDIPRLQALADSDAREVTGFLTTVREEALLAINQIRMRADWETD